MLSLIEEISSKYAIEVAEAQEIIEKTISEVLSYAIKCDVGFTIDDKTIVVYGEKEKFIFPVEKINKNIIRLIMSKLEARFQAYSTMQDYKIAKTLVGTVVGGFITKVINKDSIYIDIESEYGTLNGVCNYSNQPPKERGKYKLGHFYYFYVNRATLIKVGGVLHQEITLSRTSKSLVSGLLRKELLERFIDDIEVTCVKRMAGVYSKVLATKRIPKDCIVAVSKELKERVIVNL